MKVSYRVTLDPLRHELGVELQLSELAPGETTLMTPTWVPGDADVEKFGRDVFDARAIDPASGKHAEMRRHGWSCYTVEQHGAALTVSYRASASSVELSEGAGQLGDVNGVLLGARYLRVAAHEGRCVVHYEVPEGWAIHHPAGARALGENSWEYENYEQLLDTPVSFGRFDLVTRNVRGTEFHHVFLTRAVGFEDGVQRFVDDLARIAEVYYGIFGSFPFDSYTYVLSFNPNDSWGMEHLSSTMVGLDPATFCDDTQYKASIRVCAHELFHAWNVRRLRPNSAFSEGLWMAKGFTRYYEFLSCTRTGIYTPEQFFSAVTNYYTHLAALPAYACVSPADSSLASHLNHDKYAGRANTAIDYYDAGMVIAFELDAALRSETGGRQSLDTAFAKFYEAYAGKGLDYTIKELCAFFDERLDGLGRRLRREALEPARLDLLGRLRQLGFAVTESTVPYLGVILQDDQGPAIYSVLNNSPAGASGLASEDVIVAVDGYPFSQQSLAWAAGRQQEVSLGVLRGNQARSYTIQPGRRMTVTAMAWEGTPQQAALIAQWLNAPFSPAPGQDFGLEFYENLHGVETVI